ncbi:xanthine dehydrogenase family protein molybdopterin-binding subunit [Inquilinus limosus]|uniref:xanthine dehydrogenase family protein molybdopterin-binding subunit n=1 Tax=Inquilinus limosus TaxID=171674 RepID=UPI00047C683E|nr:xanthine dehydrogenase family protein molybdopterin-binding subunit [Inquilinus limosus]
MVRAAPEPGPNMGRPEPRIDGRRKVTGEARYPSDAPVQNPAYAVLVTSAVAKGEIAGIELEEAKAVPGVLDILTYRDAHGQVAPMKHFAAGGYASTTIRPLESARIWHDGQIVAVVTAESFEAAQDAAHRVKLRYRADPAPSWGFDAPGVDTVDAAKAKETHEDPAIGDVDAAIRNAAVVVDAEYETPIQHHNPIELFTTTCAWDGVRLTIHEPSQIVYGLKHGVAQQLGLDPDNVQVVSPFVGGAFGSKASVTPRTALAAVAARRVGRPVKLVTSRAQGFTTTTHRAETRHRIRLAAGEDGRLAALSHEGWEVTSRPDSYMVAGTDTTTRMYAAPNVASKVHLVHADRNTPGFMRAPAEVPYMYALESAMDELAVALGMDPVELRRVNDTVAEPIRNVPYSSRSLMPCYDAAAEAFGWARRDPRPGSMRDGDWLVGWGCATACYPSMIAAASARVRLLGDGRVQVATAAHDLGTGAYTVIGQAAAERLGLPLDRVEVLLGDTALPPAPVAGGSNMTASVCTAVIKACDAIRETLFRAKAGRDNDLSGYDLRDGRLIGPDGQAEELQAAFGRIGAGAIEEYAESVPKGLPPGAIDKLYRGASALTGGPGGEDFIRYAFGAEFVEVRIHARTREIRVPRMVGAFAAGRIMNPRTARSQLMGGMIWGVGSALHEKTEIDRRTARYANTDIAEYLIPVNADIGEVEVILVPEEDNKVNPAGIKGIGELGNVGTAAAVANAVYHATGKRIRALPIRIEDLLEA